MKKLVLFVLRGTAVAVVAMAAFATTVIPQTVEQLTQQSVLVVSGTAGRSWTAWDPGHTTIYTYTEFAIARTLKGPPLASVLVRQIGGSRDGMTLRVAGVRALAPGEAAVLFLRAGEPDGSGALSITGLMQGHFHYVETARGTRLSNGLPGVAHRESLSSYDAAARSLKAYAGSALSLDELESRVRQAAERETKPQ